MTLGVLVRVLADDLHGVLVGTDRAVGTEAEEHRLHAVGLGCPVGIPFEAEVGHVIDDANGELARRIIGLGRVEHSLDHRRRELLAGQAVAATEHPGHHGPRGAVVVSLLDDGGNDVGVERFADGARLFGPVEGHDGAYRRRQGGNKGTRSKGAIEANLDHPNLAAFGDELVDRLLGGADTGAHQHDDGLGIGGAYVVEQVILPADQIGEAVHGRLHLVGDDLVVEVARLPGLEEHVGVLSRAAQDRCIRVESAHPVFEHSVE